MLTNRAIVFAARLLVVIGLSLPAVSLAAQHAIVLVDPDRPIEGEGHPDLSSAAPWSGVHLAWTV